MIAVWGPPADETTLSVLDALLRRDAPVAFIDQGEVLRHTGRLEVVRGAAGYVAGWLDLPSGTYDLGVFASAYIRPHDSLAAPRVASAGPRSPEANHARKIEDLLMRWAQITPALVVNRPSAMATNNSKPYQALSARAVGFEVPATLLTTDPDAAARFAAEHGEVIYKSIGGIRSIVTRLRADDRQRLDDVRWCPTQFQAWVAGTDVRVHVVGDRVFACEIESDADDYRYGESTSRLCDLPAEQAARCVELSARLGLEVAGIDLRRTPDGAWYCFEANPSPAFACFGDEIKSAVAAAIADRLIGAEPPRRTPVSFYDAGPSLPEPDTRPVRASRAAPDPVYQ